MATGLFSRSQLYEWKKGGKLERKERARRRDG
jgi:hypothetical protein